jgi:hypothetical protein
MCQSMRFCERGGRKTECAGARVSKSIYLQTTPCSWALILNSFTSLWQVALVAGKADSSALRYYSFSRLIWLARLCSLMLRWGSLMLAHALLCSLMLFVTPLPSLLIQARRPRLDEHQSDAGAALCRRRAPCHYSGRTQQELIAKRGCRGWCANSQKTKSFSM